MVQECTFTAPIEQLSHLHYMCAIHKPEKDPFLIDFTCALNVKPLQEVLGKNAS